MAYDLFGTIKIMFTDSQEYSKQKNSDKGKHFFLINRFFAIKYPTTAQALNRIGQNSWAAVDLWQLVASRFQKVPGWIYTKTKKTSASEKSWKPNPEVAKFWMERTGLGERELKEAIKFNPEEMKKFFQSMEKQMEMNA